MGIIDSAPIDFALFASIEQTFWCVRLINTESPINSAGVGQMRETQNKIR